mgnify:CR=1 FL=1
MAIINDALSRNQYGRGGRICRRVKTEEADKARSVVPATVSVVPELATKRRQAEYSVVLGPETRWGKGGTMRGWRSRVKNGLLLGSPAIMSSLQNFEEKANTVRHSRVDFQGCRCATVCTMAN